MSQVVKIFREATPYELARIISEEVKYNNFHIDTISYAVEEGALNKHIVIVIFSDPDERPTFPYYVNVAHNDINENRTSISDACWEEMKRKLEEKYPFKEV